jgi:hypothetical protein
MIPVFEVRQGYVGHHDKIWTAPSRAAWARLAPGYLRPRRRDEVVRILFIPPHGPEHAVAHFCGPTSASELDLNRLGKSLGLTPVDDNTVVVIGLVPAGEVGAVPL